MKICFLVSAGGGNFKFFHLAKQRGIIKNVELCVIADRSCGAISYAKNNKINHEVIEYSREKNEFLVDALERASPDYIVTNWHKIIDADIVKKYSGRLINLHYSLLPAFGGIIGTVPIDKAYALKCKYVGVTCHYVDENVDSGEIITQAILKTDIPMSAAVQSVFQKGCLALLNSFCVLERNEIVTPCQNERFDFSPNLGFSELIFDEGFWAELAGL